MRPAQLTPENGPRGRPDGQGRACFNEAGAINAGKLVQNHVGSSAMYGLQ